MAIVIDASVATKWFVVEDESDRALELARREPFLMAPAIILVEVANTLWKKHRAGLFGADDAAFARSSLPRYFGELIDDAQLLDDAWAMAVALGHPIYDCLYLACAQRAGTVVITSDRRLILRLAGTSYAPLAIALADWRG
jgi:predicted nucleic acid-binding protein